MHIGPDIPSIWKINRQFILAVLLYGVAYLYWIISSEQMWFFAALAVFTAFIATVQVLKTLWLIWQQVGLDRRQRRYGYQGETPKGDRLASQDARRDARMID